VNEFTENSYFGGKGCKVKKIDHVGIAVYDIEMAKALFTQMLKAEVIHEEYYERDHIQIAFIGVGDTKVELLQPADASSSITRFLEKRGEGIHHIAFEVSDIQAEMSRLKSDGFKLLTEEPYIGAMHKLVCFIHPKSANGVLTELCQKLPAGSTAKP